MSSGDLDGDKYLILWEPTIVHAVTPMDPEPRADAASHKPRAAQQGESGHAAWVRRMPREPAPMPSEHVLAAQVAQQERLRQHQPRMPTVADHVGHSRPRRRPMTSEEVQAEGEVIEAVRQARAAEEMQTFESSLAAHESCCRRDFEEAMELHERRQEEEAVRFYIYFGKRHNLGQISNLWLAYADKLGVMHKDTLELCRLAQLAVQFVKTGMPVTLDRRRFSLATRPDYMTHKQTRSNSYISGRALGHLYRAAIAVPEPELAGNTGQRGGGELHRAIQMDGYERFLTDAIRARDAYESEIRWILKNFGVKTEAELLSGRVVRFELELVHHASQKDNEESLRRAVHELWGSTRQHFCECLDRAVSCDRADDNGGGVDALPRHTVSQQLAYAWYVAGYRLHEDTLDLNGEFGCVQPSTLPPLATEASPLRSFPWVAWPELMSALRTTGRVQRPTVTGGPDLYLDASDCITIHSSGPDLYLDASDCL